MLEDLQRERRRQVLIQIGRRCDFIVVDKVVRIVVQAIEDNLPREVLVVEVAIRVEHPDAEDAHAQRQGKGAERHVGVLVAAEFVEWISDLVRNKLFNVLNFLVFGFFILVEEAPLVPLLGRLLLLLGCQLFARSEVVLGLHVLDLDEFQLLLENLLPVAHWTN